MKILPPEEVRAAEDWVIAAGTGAEELMERAGARMAAILRREFPGPRESLFLVGKGNNGGDGLVVARHLLAAGWTVRLLLAQADLGGLCRRQWERLPGDLKPLSPRDPIPWPGADGVVIDALLGIGAKGPLRPELAETVAAVNRARAERFFRVAAVDGPTGLHAEGEAVRADLTLSIGFGKERLFLEEKADWVGRIEPVPIFDAMPEYAARREALDRELLRPLLPRRAPASHKSQFGRIAIAGGSPGLIGAPILSSLGALRVGTGLLNILVPPEVWKLVAARAPLQAMVVSTADDAFTRQILEKVHALAAGPGLGTGSAAAALLRRLLEETKAPLVIDADGLTLLARDPALLSLCRGRAVLTPHPGEMERLLGGKFSLAERPAKAAAFAEEHGVVLLLKGCRTVIAEPGRPLAYNTTGNPGLATGGSGDLLTGIIAGLLGQKLSLGDAARLGAWLHGRAADLALRARGAEEGMGGEEVAGRLADAIADLRETV
ncbi:MAG: NAD(P)H-hydrate dehydratase [Verrucomicrobium sp.]|nr:NAD(P)H-hydrate dehydratase [Verrucomicrobium sp.]